MEESGRFSGWMALASPWIKWNMFSVPGLAAKSSISLLSRKPRPGTVTPLPNPPFKV